MHHGRHQFLFVFVLVLWGPLLAAPGIAQDASHTLPRRLAPGVITTIRPEPEEEETFSGPRELVEIVRGQPQTAWEPEFYPQTETLHERSKRIIFRRQVWYLNFAFKPLRMISLDVPNPDGTTTRKLVWYLVYYVQNLGNHQSPSPEKDQFGHVTYRTTPINRRTLRFFPTFILQTHDKEQSYLDSIVPGAAVAIQRREDSAIPLRNSVQISRASILESDGGDGQRVWGVVTWTGIDPRTDYFSIFVEGLTNAYRWTDDPDGFRPGDSVGKGRKFTNKTLQLNFWRPGDSVLQHEDEIRFGLPLLADNQRQQAILKLYGHQERVDYRWVYR